MGAGTGAVCTGAGVSESAGVSMIKRGAVSIGYGVATPAASGLSLILFEPMPTPTIVR